MNTQIIDDQDPSVKYSSGWTLGGKYPEYLNTTSAANIAGLTATLQFSGIGVKVFGTISRVALSKTPTSSYSIDGVLAGNFTGEPQAKDQFKALFFQSASLSNGSHTLVVNYTGNQSAHLFLDFFEVTESTVPQGVAVSGSSAFFVNPETTGPKAHVWTPTALVTSPQTLTLSSSSTAYSISKMSSTSILTTQDPISSITMPPVSTSTNPTTGFSKNPSTSKSNTIKHTAIITGSILGCTFAFGLILFVWLRIKRTRNTSVSQRPSMQIDPFKLPEGSSTAPSSSKLLHQRTSNSISRGQYHFTADESPPRYSNDVVPGTP